MVEHSDGVKSKTDLMFFNKVDIIEELATS